MYLCEMSIKYRYDYTVLDKVFFHKVMNEATRKKAWSREVTVLLLRLSQTAIWSTCNLILYSNLPWTFKVSCNVLITDKKLKPQEIKITLPKTVTARSKQNEQLLHGIIIISCRTADAYPIPLFYYTWFLSLIKNTNRITTMTKLKMQVLI